MSCLHDVYILPVGETIASSTAGGHVSTTAKLRSYCFFNLVSCAHVNTRFYPWVHKVQTTGQIKVTSTWLQCSRDSGRRSYRVQININWASTLCQLQKQEINSYTWYQNKWKNILLILPLITALSYSEYMNWIFIFLSLDLLSL